MQEPKGHRRGKSFGRWLENTVASIKGNKEASPEKQGSTRSRGHTRSMSLEQPPSPPGPAGASSDSLVRAVEEERLTRQLFAKGGFRATRGRKSLDGKMYECCLTLSRMQGE